jgi:signal transduction histidine kinase
MGMDNKLDFVIGEDKLLSQLLEISEVLLLLNGAVKSGVCGVEIIDSKQSVLAASGEKSPYEICRSVIVEGEPVGTVLVYAPDSGAGFNGIADMLHAAVQTLIKGTMKRMLTSEAHTTIVNQSYDELLDINQKLRTSEQLYRELAESLEIKVQERTEELNKAYAEMLQKEKMAAIGGLAAGMAHEINNPIGFVISNLHTLKKYAARIVEMLEFYRKNCDPAIPVHLVELVGVKWDELKIGFVLTDIDMLVNQSLNGAERVQKLVADMRGFSHVGETGQVSTDINLEIEQTLSVLSHEIRQGTQIEQSLGIIPKIKLNPGLLSQALLQMIKNSLQLETPHLIVSIKTCQLGEMIIVQIADNGPGIPIEIRDRIFEPFFTTKDVGVGTGMGLTLAQQAVQVCGGTLAVNCPIEGGTIITVSLPVGEEQ